MKIIDNIFYRDGKKLFYLADTCWSAFTNISIKDWEYYLDKRVSQGFNVIQVNMLWQWDSSKSKLNILPYAKNEDGSFDFSKRNEKYFDRAYEMFKIAKEKGITIGLVLLWVNYLPDTWATNLKKTSIIPLSYIEEYVEYVMKRFNEFRPIYLVSGDTNFPTDEVTEYYSKALSTIKKIDNTALTTLHIRGRETYIPDTLLKDPNLDFYMFQSGHNRDYQYMAYELAEEFYNKSPNRLSINAEPCYEMMGYSRKLYGRFSREDIRRAAWQSILSGANSGITYGAHGIWSWHTEGLEFDSEIGEAFESPYDWRDALEFEGAWDYSFIKNIIEDYKLFDIKPSQQKVLNDTNEIRLAENDSYVVVYIPSNIKVKIEGDYSKNKAAIIDLESRRRSPIEFVGYNSEEGYTVTKMHRFTRDALLIINK